MSVYEETFFVGLRPIAEDEFGITGTAKLKRTHSEKGYGFADEFIRNLNEIISGARNRSRHIESFRLSQKLPAPMLFFPTML